MGQGAHTGLARIVAEELDAELASVTVVNASNGGKPEGEDVYGTPATGGQFQLTGGSPSTVGFWAAFGWLRRGRAPGRWRLRPRPGARSRKKSTSTRA
jgi:hypothetical protein